MNKERLMVLDQKRSVVEMEELSGDLYANPNTFHLLEKKRINMLIRVIILILNNFNLREYKKSNLFLLNWLVMKQASNLKGLFQLLKRELRER